MGKKKKTSTTTYVTTTTKTKLVKMTYIQTLAIANELADTTALETEGQTGQLQQLSSQTSSKFFGFKKKKTTTSAKTDTTGEKIIDQWLQPEFDKIRYAVGIRELSVAAYKFAEQSELISVPFVSPKEIVKVNVVVDEYIPPQFDLSQRWIKYFIKVEGSNNWIRINPMNSPTIFDESGAIVPKIINFNLPKPTTAQLEDKYQFTDDPVKKLRFRAVLTRPVGGDNESITPMLKSYRLIMVPRS
ncbi:MAG: hypothetical protein D6710_01840 [Nitrospirae bacterium]|nr:MAG: hypothetical protein D6710_01840 [Nitrospirota bacterium]